MYMQNRKQLKDIGKNCGYLPGEGNGEGQIKGSGLRDTKYYA